MAAGKFNVSDFVANINRTGIANPSYFMVMVTPPSKMWGYRDISAPLQFRIESAGLPTRSVISHDQNYYGPTRRVPYSFIPQDMVLSVILSEDMREREFFNIWQDLSLGPSRKIKGGYATKFDSGYYDNATYGAEITIYVFGTSPIFQGSRATTLFDSITGLASRINYSINDLYALQFSKDRVVDYVYEISLQEPYPINVNEVSMNWASGNEYARLQVQMMYRHVVESNKNYSPSSIANFTGPLNLNSLTNFTPTISMIINQGIGYTARSYLNSLLPAIGAF
jgi:hypothetical protein